MIEIQFLEDFEMCFDFNMLMQSYMDRTVDV